MPFFFKDLIIWQVGSTKSFFIYFFIIPLMLCVIRVISGLFAGMFQIL